MNEFPLGQRRLMASWGVVIAAGAWMSSSAEFSFEGSEAQICTGQWSEVVADHGMTTQMECVPPGTEVAPIRGPVRWLIAQPMDINQASLEALQVLPGIGLWRAHQILRARCGRSFESLEGLLRIRGIGERTLEGLRGRVFAGEADAPRNDCLASTTLHP